MSLQQLLPGDGSGEDLPLQPQVVVDLEILGQIHALAQHTLQAVVHRQKIGVAVRPVVTTRVEALDAGTQGALLRLEVPGTGVQVWAEGTRGSEGSQGPFSQPKSLGKGLCRSLQRATRRARSRQPPTAPTPATDSLFPLPHDATTTNPSPHPNLRAAQALSSTGTTLGTDMSLHRAGRTADNRTLCSRCEGHTVAVSPVVIETVPHFLVDG